MATAQEAIASLKSLADAYRDFLQLAYDALDPSATPEEREVMREQIKFFIDNKPATKTGDEKK